MFKLRVSRVELSRVKRDLLFYFIVWASFYHFCKSLIFPILARVKTRSFSLGKCATFFSLKFRFLTLFIATECEKHGTNPTKVTICFWVMTRKLSDQVTLFWSWSKSGHYSTLTDQYILGHYLSLFDWPRSTTHNTKISTNH